MKLMREMVWFIGDWTCFAGLRLCMGMLGKDVIVGFRVNKAQYWTVLFSIGEAGHIQEETQCDKNIFTAHAGFRSSLVF